MARKWRFDVGAIGAILCALGIIALIYGGMQKYKAGRLSSTPLVRSGDVARDGDAVAGERGAISTEGAVRCDAPLISPCSGTPCLAYELRVVGRWKSGDKQRSKTYVEELRAAAFTVDDGSGPVAVDASNGGDFDPWQEGFDERKNEGFLADLKGAVGKGEPIMFGRYAFENPPMSKADRFQCTEKYLPLVQSLYVVGKFEDGCIQAPAWTALILSDKGRAALMIETAGGAKKALMAGGAMIGVGALLGLVSQLMGQQ